MTVATPWGRGVGKSHFLRQALYLSVAQWDGVPRTRALKPMTGVRWVLMAPTFKQAKDLHADALLADLVGDGEWAWLGGKIDRTAWRIRFPGGSWIQLFGAESANTSRGLRTDGVAVDECDDVDLDVFDSVISPWFSEPWSLKIRLVCGTPRRGRYGLLYRTHRRATSRFEHERRGHHFSLHATGYDVPENVDRAYLDKMKAETPPDTFDREWLCNFDSAEGLVYSIFDESFHVRQPPSGVTWSNVIVGVDHGYEDPGVFNIIGVTGAGRDAQCYLIEEVYEQHRTESWWVAAAQKVKERFPFARWYADPSQPARIKALKTEAGVRIVGANNAIDDGVAAVADALVQRVRADETRWAQLYVSPDCPNAIREFGQYRRKRDPKSPERVTDDIEDKNNHSMDALRYALFTHFGSPSERTDLSDTDYSYG